MRIAFLVIGAVLSGLYSLAGACQFIHALWTNNPVSGAGISMIAANVLPLCVGGVIFLSCLSAIRRKNLAENNA